MICSGNQGNVWSFGEAKCVAVADREHGEICVVPESDALNSVVSDALSGGAERGKFAGGLLAIAKIGHNGLLRQSYEFADTDCGSEGLQQGVVVELKRLWSHTDCRSEKNSFSDVSDDEKSVNQNPVTRATLCWL